MQKIARRRAPAHDVASWKIDAVRAFNRFYTKKIGLLQRGLLDSPHSLTEVRVLYEIANHKNLTATDLIDSLGIDRGYLSRILRSFEQDGMVKRKRSKGDRRSSLVRLTARGRAVFSGLDKRQSDQVAQLLESIPVEAQNDLVGSMRGIEQLLDTTESPAGELRLRPHRPGDMGWVMFMHGVLYKREYGWDERFEALVGEIVVSFIRSFDSKCERCWIAEVDGERVGSIFLVKDTSNVAKLRLLLVTPAARGRGVGKRLVDECIACAREMGYSMLTLWTNSVLDAARHIYEGAGFRLVKEEEHKSFGHQLTGQYWELVL
jgi:DNA-binding MarR family transcriptional regulator/N-acetylglutamate synthase-like GNAT family acetyltransferase